ncbi:MAG: FRG domain-containing protein [Geobacter sp.]|nr:FRG domain-containing protein [Geobacter sp.]
MIISPKNPDTSIDLSTQEWIPATLDGFMAEMNHIISSCRSKNSMVLFRGHRKREWLLDSTFVRSCKASLFGLPPEARLSSEITGSMVLHRVFLNLFLLKYGVLVRPTPELEELSAKEGIDAWFELMKRYQQYQNKDLAHLKGSNLVDWTESSDVAIYFANCKRDGAGAVYICDATATGKTLQTIPVGEILYKMNEAGNAGKALGCPLLFCPPKQIHCIRAKNQQAMYFAQMDLRADLETQWRLCEKNPGNETILIKLVLPSGCEEDVEKYLVNKGITDKFIYPDG